MNEKRIIALAACIFMCAFTSLYSQSTVRKVERGEESWRYLIKAQNAFDAGNFGDAVTFAETASAREKQRCDWEVYMLENLLKKREVRKAASSLNDVFAVLKELELTEQEEIIRRRIDERGRDFFNSDLQTLIQKEEYLSHCPEADFILSKVFKIEGEFDLCREYLERAWKYHLNLRIEEQRFDILYELARVCNDTGDDDGYEKYLLLIMTENTYFTDENFMKALVRFPNEDSAEGVEKFFLLYRNESYRSLEALVKLSRFYEVKNQNEKSLRCAALGSIIALTKIEETLKSRLIDYEYTTFADAIYISSRYKDIMDWGGNNEIWQLFLTFASSCVASGKLTFGTKLYQILAASLDDSYWKNLAEARLIR